MIEKISLENLKYPRILKKINKPPKALYVRGKLLPKEKCLGVVGTRLCSSYGKQIALDIAGELASAGLTIVSGLAPGIDTLTHKAVLERQKRTIAVVGTGVDEKSIYPKENILLARQIVEGGGAVVSEYPPGTNGTKFTFPQRNRIISGLSLGVVVIEAKEKSGALITAGYAKQQGRSIFAVPGSIYSANSKGPNKLIKDGAFLAENAKDILEKLQIAKSLPLPQTIKYDNADQEFITNILKEGQMDIDIIIEKTRLPVENVASSLATLEIKGIVRNLGRNIYALKNTR